MFQHIPVPKQQTQRNSKPVSTRKPIQLISTKSSATSTLSQVSAHANFLLTNHKLAK